MYSDQNARKESATAKGWRPPAVLKDAVEAVPVAPTPEPTEHTPIVTPDHVAGLGRAAIAGNLAQ